MSQLVCVSRVSNQRKTGKKNGPRGFWEQQDKQSENDSWRHLNTQADPPLSRAGGWEVYVTAISNPCCKQRPDPQHKLLQRGDPATNARVSQLSLVQGDDHDEETDAESSNSYTHEL